MIDINSDSDNRGITLNWVGISNYKHPVQFRGFNTIADICFYVNLIGEKRAIHMSRLIEVLQDLVICDIFSIDILLLEALTALETNSVRLELKFPYILKKMSPVTQMQGHVPYNCELICEKYNDTVLWIKYKITIPVTSVCPCSKSISEYGAHNQRGFVTIEFSSDIDVGIISIVSIVEKNASSEVYSLLKRPDEKHVTENGYANAKFVEDITRDIILLFPEHLKKKGFRVRVENLESIHAHNAVAIYQFD
jgi:GTP cyclohydrolase I